MAKINTSVKNAEARIRKNCFQDSLSDKVAKGVILAPQGRVLPEHADSEKSLFMKIMGAACIWQDAMLLKRENQATNFLFQSK